MSFQEMWPKAKINGGDGTSPPPGSYEVLLKGASAFTSKGGVDVVKLELEVVSEPERGHEWTELHNFSSQGKANALKATVSRLGIDVDAISSFSDLDTALGKRVGSYYTVDVVQKGDYLNTYIDGPSTPARQEAPMVASVSDEDVPF